MTAQGIPTFYLYGEPHQAVAEGFLHVEQLDDRSRPSEWTIRPHEHADLCQIFVVDVGGGIMQSDARTLDFRAPALLVVPAGVVHGFRWHDESIGTVVTLAQSYVSRIVERHAELRAVFAAATVVSDVDVAPLRVDIATLQRELSWSASGHHAAVEAALTGLMVKVLRHVEPAAGTDPGAPGHQAKLVARYRARINERFRLRETVAQHAAALGTSETRLRAACTRIAGRSPAAMLDDRAMLEAQRMLLYSNLSIAEVGFSLGFGDPAYFSRFFRRHARCSARAFRDPAATVPAETSARCGSRR
ncbi:helix-turn-helix domain-containing protein [Sphingomonas adhaesiva]|uniref:helix-turn-helix domain-containing protein n=1 Tax=Sphingomonas adhaesiva TaxID=28212 RepID=UPI002FF94A9C